MSGTQKASLEAFSKMYWERYSELVQQLDPKPDEFKVLVEMDNCVRVVYLRYNVNHVKHAKQVTLSRGG